MKVINVTVRNKIAKNNREYDGEYICGNSDFVIVFDFDEEWDAFTAKTARFKYNGLHRDVVFTGNQVNVPIIENAHTVEVGVYAGNLHTTTPAIFTAKKSILCGTGVPEWAKAETKPTYTAKEVGAISYNKQTPTEEQKAQARENIGVPEIVCTVSGDVIAVTDSLNRKLRGLNLFGKTTQNGTPTPESPVELESVGDDGSVAVTVCGKNLLPIAATTQTINGVTYTVNSDGSVTVNGTANSDSWIRLIAGYRLPVGEYIITGCPAGGDNVTKYAMNINTGGPQWDAGSGKIFSITDPEKNNFVDISVRNGCTVSNLVFYPMIRHASIADATYEPYKAQNLTVQTPNGLPGILVSSGGNYTDENGQQWICDEIDFARGKYVQRIGKEVLKGTPTFVETPDNPGRFAHSGCLSNTYKNGSNIAFSNFAIWKPWGISSGSQTVFAPSVKALYFSPKDAMTADAVNAMFAEMIASDNPPIIIGQLETPIETDLTAEEIAQYSALHTNYPNTTIYNDEGAGIAVKYVADTKLYIDNKFSELQNAILSAGANI